MARRRSSHLFIWVRRLVVIALLAFLALLAWGYGRSHPEDLPWTPLKLSQPVGLFTGRKLAALHGNGCRTLLTQAGISFTPVPPLRDGNECGFDDAVRLQPDGSADVAFHPAGVETSCRLAAGLALWEWNVVQPAALARFGKRVVEIDHFGSYNCRRMYGRASEPWSEHARANASTSPASGWRMGGRSASPPTGAIPAPRVASSTRYATEAAACSRQCSRPITMRRITTISTSTRRVAVPGAGAPAADSVQH